jgi:hypothetical protein
MQRDEAFDSTGLRGYFGQLMRCPIAALCLGLLLGACRHEAPFAPGDYGSDQPFAAGSPRRLTFNPGNDRAPAWLPDESGLLYSAQGVTGSDRCLALLPPGGGRVQREICDSRSAVSDSTFIFTEPAPAPDGRLAYLVLKANPSGVSRARLVLATLANPLATDTILAFPLVAPDTVRQDEASQPRWLDAVTLVYLALHVGYDSARSRDTVRTGAEIVRLELGGAVPNAVIVPETRDASSLAIGGSPDAIYFTLGGDTRVFRRALSSGAVTVIFDFGAAGIARDVQVTGNRLVAVVGGAVSFGYEALLGFNVQRDGGGPLHLVDLATGHDSVLPDRVDGIPLFFRRPVLSPSGRRLVAEVVTGSVADLWMLDLP